MFSKVEAASGKNNYDIVTSTDVGGGRAFSHVRTFYPHTHTHYTVAPPHMFTRCQSVSSSQNLQVFTAALIFIPPVPFFF